MLFEDLSTQESQSLLKEVKKRRNFLLVDF